MPPSCASPSCPSFILSPSCRNSYDAILLLLTAAVVLSAIAACIIGARAGYHVLHEEERMKERVRRSRARGRRGRLVANDRGLRLTTTSRANLSVDSDSGSLGESLLGVVAMGDDSEDGGAEAELAHERQCISQLEGELSEARQQSVQQAQQEHGEEKQRLCAELEQLRSSQAEAGGQL